MGHFITVQPQQIRPSQDFLKPKAVAFILDCLKHGRVDELPPPPIVRSTPNGRNYIAIDGHNLIAVQTYMREAVLVYVAQSQNDGLDPADMFNASGVAARNKDLAEKYDMVVTASQALENRHLSTFTALIQAHPGLFASQ